MGVRFFRRWGGAALIATATLLPAAARACSICGCGDPLVQAGDSAPQRGLFRLSLDAEYVSGTAASDDDPRAHESLDQYTLRPWVVFSPVNALNVVLQLPLVHKQWSLQGPDGAERASPTGIGDLDLGGRWFVFQRTSLASRSRTELATTFGTSFPTGSVSARVDGIRIDDHAQLGTGGFGPYVGIFGAHHADTWTWTASVSVRAHTPNAYAYRYGNTLLWSADGQYLVLPHLATGLGLEGRSAARDLSSGEHLENTGGFVLSATPTLAYGVSDDWWLHLRGQVPVATALNGVQTVGAVFTLGIQYGPN